MVMNGFSDSSLLDQVPVEPLQDLAGRHQAVLLAEDLLGPDTLLEKDGQQAGRARRGPWRRRRKSRGGARRGGRRRRSRRRRGRRAGSEPRSEPGPPPGAWRQEALLDTAGQFQLLVDLLVGRLQPLVDAMDLRRPSRLRRWCSSLMRSRACTWASNSLGREGPQQVGVGPALEAGQPRVRGRIGSHEQQGDKAVGQTRAQAAAQLQGLAAGVTAFQEDQAKGGQVVRIRRPEAMPATPWPARSRQCWMSWTAAGSLAHRRIRVRAAPIGISQLKAPLYGGKATALRAAGRVTAVASPAWSVGKWWWVDCTNCEVGKEGGDRVRKGV